MDVRSLPDVRHDTSTKGLDYRDVRWSYLGSVKFNSDTNGKQARVSKGPFGALGEKSFIRQDRDVTEGQARLH